MAQSKGGIAAADKAGDMWEKPAGLINLVFRAVFPASYFGTRV